MEDDDDGFYGYVEQTVSPGPTLLILTIAICSLFLSLLPVAVTLGDRYERLRKRSCENDTDEEAEDEQRSDSDGASVSSKATYYSEVYGTLKDALGQHGRGTRSTGHRRRRRRRRAAQDSQTQTLQAEMGILANTEETIKDGTQPTPPPGSSMVDSESKIVLDIDKEESSRTCTSTEGVLDEMGAIMAWDPEMRRIIKLAIPFATQAIFTGALDVLTVGVVGKLIGTRAVSAFVVVNMLVELTTEFTGGFPNALATLCSQAIGAENHHLAGQYVQIATILYLVTSLPFMAFWIMYIDAAMEWLGFDEETVRIGQQYTYVLVVDYWIEGVSDSIHGLLDVAGFENFSTLIGITEEAIAFLIILVWALVGNPDLMSVAYVQFSLGVLFIFLNAGIIFYKGWFKPYRNGMIGTFALSDCKAVLLVCKTALSLSFGYLLTDGEWELLTIFASFLGPAEVAAWGIFGSVWDAINELIDGISDASEVRCAYLLGSGQAEQARLSAFKSLTICIFTALFITSLLFMAGEDMPTWLTNDPALQSLLKDLMPMFGLGNAAMAIGTMSWTLLGAQGRYRLATVVVGLVSWLVTLPLGAFFSIYLNLDLQGQTSAVVIGYILAGSIHAYFLFRSDWALMSKNVQDDNENRVGNNSTKPEERGEHGAQDEGVELELSNSSWAGRVSTIAR